MWDELLKPGASGAPTIVEWGAIAVGIAIATFVGRRSMTLGRAEAGAAPANAEIAGAIIDATKADELIKAIETLTLEAANLAAAIKSNSRGGALLGNRLERNTEAVHVVTGQIEEARDDLKANTRELITLSAKQG